jgi:hypothetical protein
MPIATEAIHMPLADLSVGVVFASALTLGATAAVADARKPLSSQPPPRIEIPEIPGVYDPLPEAPDLPREPAPLNCRKVCELVLCPPGERCPPPPCKTECY